MSHESAIEVKSTGETNGMVDRILNGEVFVMRGCLQQLGLYELLNEASLVGIRKAAGNDVADRVRDRGFAKIHEFVDPAAIPAVTDAVYDAVTAVRDRFLAEFVPRVFPEKGSYYFEKSANVRFHIPYDRAAAQKRQFEKFAKTHGEGKVSAHGPHRDPWVDCPENVINVWIAVGPVLHGNGLTVFSRDYHTHYSFERGYITSGKLHKPLSFELEPGDVILFHSNHLHGSELNRTDETRYVISFRIAFGKPYYPHGHYHHYLHAGLAGGPFAWFAEVPQNLQWSFFRYQWQRIRNKLTGKAPMSGHDKDLVADESPEKVQGPIEIADFPVGDIRALSKTVCVARLGNDEFAAVSRHCPHAGGDLTGGWIDDGKIVCPLHSMTFDPETGASPCSALKPLRRYSCRIQNGKVSVNLNETDNRSGTEQARTAETDSPESASAEV